MGELTKGWKAMFALLQVKKSGDVITENEIERATGWKRNAEGKLVSLHTYMGKNKLARYFQKDSTLSADRYRILRDGKTLNADEFHADVTQASPERLVLHPRMILRGAGGNYELSHEIGNGAVGHVWNAVHDSQPFALKIVDPRPDLLKGSVFKNVQKRFEREAKNGKQMKHDCVIQVLDTGTHAGRPFLVMSLAETSAGALLKTRSLPAKEAHQIVLRTADGLLYLHSNGHVHRDVKPDNILRLDRGWVLGDLGIVRWSDFSQELISAGTITRNSVQLGSWYYMAPEQQETPHDATINSDTYALGVTWYELLTNELPSPQRFMAKAISPIAKAPEAYDMILRMTLFDPTARPSMKEIRALAAKLAKTP